MTNTDRLTIRLDEETYQYIKLLSEHRGLPMARIVREMLQRYLERHY